MSRRRRRDPAEGTARVIREMCGEARLTQQIVADRIGVHRTTVADWMSGQSEPSVTKFRYLARICRVDPAEAVRRVGLLDPIDRSEYRIAVRPSDERAVDDVVVRDVSTFRLEQMDVGNWWGCCFLGDETEGNRISFSILYDPALGDVVVRVNEWPNDATYEEGAGPPPE